MTRWDIITIKMDYEIALDMEDDRSIEDDENYFIALLSVLGYLESRSRALTIDEADELVDVALEQLEN